MKTKHSCKYLVFLIVMLVSLILFGCSTDTATEPPESIPQQESAETDQQPTEVEPTVNDPEHGGTFVISGYSEPSSLDPAYASASIVIQYIGASLVTLTPEGDIVPYLAESWESIDEGLKWIFHLREDVKFTDGSPLTAHDYAWTFNRALAPETASPIMPMLLGDIASVEATDDYTLVLTYNSPFSSLLFNLCDSGYTQPLSQSAFENGLTYEHEHVSVGPFKLKEWVSGDHLTFERNPDFVWGPAFAHQGPVYLDEVIFRFIPEYATIMAGLEAGEIHATNVVQTQDLQRLVDFGEFNIISSTKYGIWPGIWMNVNQDPFNDINVRQALSYAVDRESINDLVYSGHGQVTSGPLNSGTFGYNAEVEDYGYSYNLEKAAQLMEEAGYTLNKNNIWEKDSTPMQFTLKVGIQEETFRKMAEILQSQWKAFGVEATIEMSESVFNSIMSDDYSIAMTGVTWAEGGEFLRLVFHSGQLNLVNASDPELDSLLNKIANTMDPVKRQEAIDRAAIHITEKAYVITTVAKPEFMVVNNTLDGVKYGSIGVLYLYDIFQQ